MSHPLHPLLMHVQRKRTFKNNVFAADPETLVHECAHISTLLGVKSAAALIETAITNETVIDVHALIKLNRKTIAGRDLNEVKTTAVTVLAMDRLTGGTLSESVRSMLGNIQEMPREKALLQFAEFLTDRRVDVHAKNLANTLLRLQALVYPWKEKVQ